jgi:ribosomal protein S20
MKESTINGLKRDELRTLIKELITDINSISQSKEKVDKLLQEVEKAHTIISGDEEKEIE